MTSFGQDLLKKMLEPHPQKRITLENALNHKFFQLSDEAHDEFFHNKSPVGNLKMLVEEEEEEEKFFF